MCVVFVCVCVYLCVCVCVCICVLCVCVHMLESVQLTTVFPFFWNAVTHVVSKCSDSYFLVTVYSRFIHISYF